MGIRDCRRCRDKGELWSRPRVLDWSRRRVDSKLSLLRFGGYYSGKRRRDVQFRICFSKIKLTRTATGLLQLLID